MQLPTEITVLAGSTADIAGQVPWLSGGMGGSISSLATVAQICSIMIPLLVIKGKILRSEKEEHRERLNRIEEEITGYEIQLNNVEIGALRELESVSKRARLNAPNIRKYLAILGQKLIKIEKLEVELEERKAGLRRGMNGAINSVLFRKELKKIDEEEYELYLKKEHVLAIFGRIDSALIRIAEREHDAADVKLIMEMTGLLKKVLNIEIKEGRTVRKGERYE